MTHLEGIESCIHGEAPASSSVLSPRVESDLGSLSCERHSSVYLYNLTSMSHILTQSPSFSNVRIIHSLTIELIYRYSTPEPMTQCLPISGPSDPLILVTITLTAPTSPMFGWINVLPHRHRFCFHSSEGGCIYAWAYWFIIVFSLPRRVASVERMMSAVS